MRVSLVNVQYHEGNNVFPPLGVLYIGAVLREAGHEVQILDGDPAVQSDLADQVAAFSPDWVGLSFLTMTVDRARVFSQHLKTLLPRVPLVGGGAHVTADPEGSLDEMPLDAVVVGEGEQTALELCDAFTTGQALHQVPGVVTAEGTGPARSNIEDLDELPFPARDLLGHALYLRPPGLIRGYASERIASVLASRGCPFACSFCASKQQLGKPVRRRSVANLMAELDHLVASDDIRGMYFVDDVFTFERPWVINFCEALAARPYKLIWGCQARVTEVDFGLMQAMRQAGCVQIDFGVESGSAAVLKRMQKGITPERVEEAFSLAHRAGLRTGASFVLGTPGETEADLAETEALARRIKSDWTVFFFSTPYPGTPLWKATREFHEAYPAYGETWNNRVTEVPFEQGALPAPLLAAARKRMQNQAFRRNYLHKRNISFIVSLLPVLRDKGVQQVLRGVVLKRGRADDLVEAAFSAWRVQQVEQTQGSPTSGGVQWAAK